MINYIEQYYQAILDGREVVGRWIRIWYKMVLDGVASGTWLSHKAPRAEPVRMPAPLRPASSNDVAGNTRKRCTLMPPDTVLRTFWNVHTPQGTAGVHGHSRTGQTVTAASLIV